MEFHMPAVENGGNERNLNPPSLALITSEKVKSRNIQLKMLKVFIYMWFS